MKNKKCIQIITVLALSIALVFTACEKKETASEDTASNKEADTVSEDTGEDRKLFGTFKTKTLDGEDATEEIFTEADLTMVNIWGTFCGPCIKEMPDLGEISREYEEKGFQIIGLISDVSEPGDETAQEILESTGADYKNIVASVDLKNGILSMVQVVPTTIFVDSEGNQVGDAYSGAQDKESWKLIIEKLLVMVQ